MPNRNSLCYKISLYMEDNNETLLTIELQEIKTADKEEAEKSHKGSTLNKGLSD